MEINGVAAVTGAGQGIGLGITAALARRGFDVLALVLESSMEDAVRAATQDAKGDVRVDVLDVTNPGNFAFPDDLRVVVNNAGVRRAYLPVEMSESEEWRATFDVNFFGLVEMTRRAIPILRAAGRGVICNISSAALHSRCSPFLAPYRTSKAAVSALCESLRIELAPFGIRIVEIMPGPTVSGINADSILRRIADAVEFPDYAPMAELQFGYSKAVPGATPAEVAGETIVDAILDDVGPMRYGTDAVSNAGLEKWRHTPDEEAMEETLERYAALIAK
jgi:NAD(P)-dependent dehydrogenase (short-subunit alcohol dehydrogenase family)